jgi:hypothetical protein
MLRTIGDCFAVGDADTPLDRALLREQFRVLTAQVPFPRPKKPAPIS